ncbi:MAG: glucosylceramidase [Treponema sp.]|nr:glucosylceramidase [Candidatus Treponema equifaecale]
MKVISLYETAKDTDRRIESVQPATRKATVGRLLSCSIELNCAQTFQKVKGFGCALTESAGYVLSFLDEEQQKKLVESCFGKSENSNRYVFARTHMNSCDFSLENWSCVPKKDETLESFSFERTDRYMTPLLKAATESSEKLTVMVTPWSPPEWMKTNNDMNHGGKLKAEYYDLWAKYFVKYLSGLKERGINVGYVSIQNEPEAVQIWDSCIWTVEEEGKFAVNCLRPALDKAGFENVKILTWDHNRDNLVIRFEKNMSLPGAEKAIAGAAYHWYSGDQYDHVEEVSKKWPDKDLFFTEGSIEGGSRPGMWYCGERYGHNVINDLNSGCTAWIDWNMLLNIEGGPNHVNNNCDAAILVDTEKKEVVYQNSYYYLGHFSRFIEPGSSRLGCDVNGFMTPATVDGRMGNTMEACAFRRPDNRIALVVMNRTEADMLFELKLCDDIKDKTEEKVYTSCVDGSNEDISFVCPPRSIQTYIIEA